MKKTALVTGGSKGIGAAVVKRLCREGYSVAVNYNSSEQSAKSLCSELRSLGYTVHPFKCDVSSPSEVKRMFEEITDTLGSVDVLVNNAGISLWGLFDETSESQWDDVINTNLKSVFNCCKKVLPYMLSNKYGRIINISSVWGQTGASCETVYSASKAGVIGLTKALAKEYAPSGITVNCIAPGVIDTDMMKRFSEEEKAAVCEEIPIGRMGTPEEVASAVAFFASEDSAYVTGQIIGVNGGMV